jgi:hypothetical protein
MKLDQNARKCRYASKRTSLPFPSLPYPDREEVYKGKELRIPQTIPVL